MSECVRPATVRSVGLDVLTGARWRLKPTQDVTIVFNASNQESVVANEMGSTLPKINRRQARELSRVEPEQRTAAVVSTIVDRSAITTESQARELAKVEPEQAPLRWQSFDANGEPLCALPEDQPAPLPSNAWATVAPLTFHDAALSIVRSQHHLNTEL